MKSSKKQERYNSFTIMDFQLFSFIDSNFILQIYHTGVICPIQHQKQVLDLIEFYFNLHPLIPINQNGDFLTKEEIWKKAQYPFWSINGLTNSTDKINYEVQVFDESSLFNVIESDNENDLKLDEIKKKIEKHE
ncbi:10427_t:CDS:2 [Cetraspora pellucida]|uniref:10427_t:CDS:1 n=1 Tax=Cetraspora pellucida TaxID=1433469 RepID=A0A9N9H887_9GLOM|nr:10427_t:CDS:2 [Cetraspora pellucida]